MTSKGNHLAGWIVNEAPTSDEIAAAIDAAIAEERDFQYLLGVEWAVRQMSKQEDWPESWRAGFPGLKVQALLDRQAFTNEIRARKP